ncbi:MAG: acetyl-CoA carboxylase biotin carboxyl carrier protein [Candidatus Zixiibacteriota bacterium]|nr:MAG: acetyl-CoA carboxylase biotin carboxyl carrier protein [candidate division Zixibacteria bacterium]
MKEKTIKKLIKLVETSDIDQLEVSSWGRKVRITRRLRDDNGNTPQADSVRNIPAPVAESAPANPAPENVVEAKPTAAEKRYVEVKSPMVGTFYAAPAPDVPPYVTLNQKIVVGQVVCIVEAMKLMNEIESEVAGRVVKVMIENAQPVEFGQVLFLIDPEG